MKFGLWKKVFQIPFGELGNESGSCLFPRVTGGGAQRDPHRLSIRQGGLDRSLGGLGGRRESEPGGNRALAAVQGARSDHLVLGALCPAARGVRGEGVPGTTRWGARGGGGGAPASPSGPGPPGGREAGVRRGRESAWAPLPRPRIALSPPQAGPPCPRAARPPPVRADSVR